MSKSKALLFSLKGSISFGRLSILGKVLFPLLVLESDDQGRGLAEPDAIRWKVCPNVDELTTEAIDGILKEMAFEHIDLLHLYTDSRGRRLYQFKRWWVPDIGSGSCLQWARPSEYEAPEGWVDRVRLQQGPGKPPLVKNWDTPGGFMPIGQTTEVPNQVPSEVPNQEHGEQNNLTQSNLTEGKEDNGATAPPSPSPPPETSESGKPKKPPPKQPTQRGYTVGQRGYLAPFGASRFRTNAQRDAVLAMEREHGTKKLIEAATWAAEKGMSVGDSIAAVRTALPNWGNRSNGGGKQPGQARAGPTSEPASFAGIRAWMEQEGVTLDG